MHAWDVQRSLSVCTCRLPQVKSARDLFDVVIAPNNIGGDLEKVPVKVSNQEFDTWPKGLACLTIKFKGTFAQGFDLRYFPFDVHYLTIMWKLNLVEDSERWGTSVT